MHKPPFSVNRRRLLRGGAAAAATGLSGCVTTGNPMFDNLLKKTVSDLGSQFASDAIFSALGVPNRMAFVSGHPMTPEEKQAALRVRAQFQAANVTVQEMPTDPRTFNATAKAKPSGAIRMTSRSPQGWAGSNNTRGRDQLSHANAILEKYKNKRTFTVKEAVTLVDAIRPFTTALYELEKGQSIEGRTKGIVVAPRSSVKIPMRTACLGAGLPLPSAGEGTRLVNVAGAVHPDQRGVVNGLLNYAAQNENDIYAVQHLIWKLIHADNSGYQNLFNGPISAQYQNILDKASPGGYRRYKQLLDEAFERRKLEEKKLAMANMAIKHLNLISGMSFGLVPPAGVSPTSPLYAESLLKQGRAEAMKGLQGQLSGLASNFLGQSVNSMLNSAGLGVAAPMAKDMMNRGEQALLEQFTESNSPFSPIQGYTELAPDVGAHITDIGGASSQVELTLVNSSGTPFHYIPSSTGGITPHRSQAQALMPDMSVLNNRNRDVDFRNDTSQLSAADKRVAEAKAKAFADLARKAVIQGIDAVKDSDSAFKKFGPNLRFAPGIGSMIAAYDLYSYFAGDGRDMFGEEINASDAVFASLSLVPGAGQYLGAFAKTGKQLFGSSYKYVEVAAAHASSEGAKKVINYSDWTYAISKSGIEIMTAAATPAAPTLATQYASTAGALSRLGDSSVSDTMMQLSRTI